MTELNASAPAEPMSDERIAEVRSRVASLEVFTEPRSGAVIVPSYTDMHALSKVLGKDIPDLLAEVERLRAVEYQCGHCGEWEPADGDGEGQFCQSCGAEMILDECDSRDVLSGLRTDLAAAHERAEMFGTRLQQALDDKNTAAAHATNRYSRLHLEHTRLAEELKRVSDLHRPVAAHAGDPDDDDTLTTACAYCSVPYPCQTITALDGTEAGR